ncbi:hypothetical protein SAMN05216548_102207 [Faunimonas pinastri]|uniref:Uncharacterized protein n=1 Tax=Faunimonas pinastri TaxID=1855383 RepID=A0A1H9CP56_9HYPH|nr:hypothetical protein [Faunimonas pinastri]SEQ02837.1 hypothetical protein SAMN05216548_102207 [Faunimonas pinastri]
MREAVLLHELERLSADQRARDAASEAECRRLNDLLAQKEREWEKQAREREREHEQARQQEREGEIESLRQARDEAETLRMALVQVTSELATRERQIHSLKRSFSWKLTRPVRSVTKRVGRLFGHKPELFPPISRTPEDFRLPVIPSRQSAAFELPQSTAAPARQAEDQASEQPPKIDPAPSREVLLIGEHSAECRAKSIAKGLATQGWRVTAASADFADDILAGGPGSPRLLRSPEEFERHLAEAEVSPAFAICLDVGAANATLPLLRCSFPSTRIVLDLVPYGLPGSDIPGEALAAIRCADLILAGSGEQRRALLAIAPEAVVDLLSEPDNQDAASRADWRRALRDVLNG